MKNITLILKNCISYTDTNWQLLSTRHEFHRLGLFFKIKNGPAANHFSSILQSNISRFGTLLIPIFDWFVNSISDEGSLPEIALSGASKLASTYFTLFYRSVDVLYTEIETQSLLELQC